MRTREECPLCGAAAARAEHYVRTATGSDLYQCPSCGLIYGKEYLGEEDLLGGPTTRRTRAVTRRNRW